MGMLLLLTLMLAAFPGCAATPALPLSAATRVLGTATVYHSAAGERVEVVRDSRAGVAILKLPDGTVAVLPEEYAGSEGRFKDSRMTAWERDGALLLWIDGKVAFSGRIRP